MWLIIALITEYFLIIIWLGFIIEYFLITVYTLSIRGNRAEQNNVDPDLTPKNAASDQDLRCLALLQLF